MFEHTDAAFAAVAIDQLGTNEGLHMHCERVAPLPFDLGQAVVRNLEIAQVDAENNLLLVKGAVPGPKGSLVLIRDAVKGGK